MTQRNADILVALISLAWGVSYVCMKVGLEGLGAFNLVALRLGIAFVVTYAVFFRRLTAVDKTTLRCSALTGFILFGIFTGLMLGVKHTTASSAGFLASTAVVFVPLLQTAITRRLPRPPVMAGVCLAMIGIALLTLKTGDSLTLGAGALLCVAAALLYAVHILVINVFTRRTDSLALGVYQLGFAALYALAFSLAFETPSLPATGREWLAMLVLALVCSAFGWVMQPIAQKYTTPERTALLFALEPVFSAFFGYLFLDERFGGREYLGAALVLASVFISGMKEKRRDKSQALGREAVR